MKRAIIVGASRGIGRAIAYNFLKHGIGVTLVSKNEDNLRRSCRSLQQYATENGYNASVHYKICDIANDNDIDKCCKQLVAPDQCPIDILINSAGITHNKLLVAAPTESIRTVLNVNLLGTMLFTKSIVKQMIKQGHGSVVTIGSIIGMRGNIGQTSYSASKAGLVGFTRSLAKELGPKGITVNLIAPGFIRTDMTTESLNEAHIKEIEHKIVLQRIGTPDEVAKVAYFLGTSSYITGQVFNVDGGLSLTL